MFFADPWQRDASLLENMRGDLQGYVAEQGHSSNVYSERAIAHIKCQEGD